MIRTNAIQIVVNSPSKGLMTLYPPDLQDDGKAQFLTVAENVRAEKGRLAAAPGNERVCMDKVLDGEVTMIHQPRLVLADKDAEATPVIGTAGKLYSMRRRSKALVCPTRCTLRWAAVADSGSSGTNAKKVADMVRGWAPDLVLHAGDLAYADAATDDGMSPYEDQVARHYAWAIGGYDGVFGKGPDRNQFFPALGNHDWDYQDGDISRYLGFFALPGNERYYTFKRGPVQFFIINSYGYGPTGTGPDGESIEGTGADPGVGEADLSSTGPQGVWLQEQLSLSDCPWRVVVWHHPPRTSDYLYSPGYSVMDWPLGEWGADVLINGHAHNYERLSREDGVLHLVCGLGGHSRRGFDFEVQETSVVRYASRYGALKFEATQTYLKAEFWTVDGVLRDTAEKTTDRELALCYSAEATSEVTRLVIRPTSAEGDIGFTFPFTAIATRGDGVSEDVSLQAAWTSSSPSIASVDSTGKVTGAKVGSVTISATYGGETAYASYEVHGNCEDEPQDIVLVLDRSLSMSISSPPEGSRISRLKTAVNLFLDTLKTGDRVATVSFSGDFDANTPDTTIHHQLTEDWSEARTAVATLQASGDTAIADAVLRGTEVLFTGTWRPSTGKMIILVTDGYANVADTCGLASGESRLTCCLGQVTAAMDAAKLGGARVAVVALDLKTNAPLQATVAAWASDENLYFPISSPDELLPVLSLLRYQACIIGGSSGSGIGLSQL